MLDDKEGSTECFENCKVTVVNNKVVYIYYKNMLGYDAEISDKNYFNNFTFQNPYSLRIGENKEIKNGFLNFKLLCDADMGVKLDINYKIYFNDYISLFEKATNNDINLKKKYKSISKFQPMSEGWHKAYLTNNADLCEVRYTYVENNKVIKYLNPSGFERIVYSGGAITNAKTTIQIEREAFKQNSGMWQNSVLSKATYQIYEVYFVD
jgi:hypothetical protein